VSQVLVIRNRRRFSTINDGDASPTLTKEFYLDLASIVAGTKYRGQFEERMKAILEECKANQTLCCLLMNYTIIGAGGIWVIRCLKYFKPALARGELQVGATTLDE
jgi:ATP-dependent Clp protease ATP-binding subunit ClpE